MVGKFHEYLVIKMAGTDPEYYQEVQDLIRLAKEDYELSVVDIHDADEWFVKWFGNHSPIEKVKTNGK